MLSIATEATTDTPETAQPPLHPVAPTAATRRKIAIICSKGSLDMAYPGLILANAARMSGVDAVMFFTFWGLDIINPKKMDDLAISTVGNPSMGMPSLVGNLPGMQAFATSQMKKKMAKLDVPPVREMIEILSDSGAKLYACKLAAEMMDLKKEDLAPQVDGIITAMDFFDKTRNASIVFI
jgi:peroxiredoxin family protein